ncbi:MAG: TolC family protein, partial [Phycisphaerae bacterium]|nr:TolC family protein [Phycisphaerae bacterium]
MKKSNLLLMLVAVLCAGCVDPGSYDVNDVSRLQQAIVNRGATERSSEGLDPYLPGSSILPPIKVTKDPKTKRNRVDLTLQQVIMLTLANDTEIQVVSFSPEIAREQMVEAAAEFDYSIFGTLGYDRSDTAVRNFTGLADPGRTASLEVGLRQKTITGATWELTNTMVRSWDDAATVAANKWVGNNLGLELTQPLLRGAWPEVNLANLKIARINHKISMSKFRSKVETRTVEAMTAYYNLIRTRKIVKIAETLFDVTQKTYLKMEDRRPLDATDVQVMQSLAAVKTREAILLSARKDAKDAQDKLVNIISDQQFNYLEDFDLIPTEPLSKTLVKLDEADQLLTALRLSPSLEQARLAIQNADINIVVAKNDMLPTLNFVGGVSLDGGSTESARHAWNDFVSGD